MTDLQEGTVLMAELAVKVLLAMMARMAMLAKMADLV